MTHDHVISSQARALSKDQFISKVPVPHMSLKRLNFSWTAECSVKVAMEVAIGVTF